MKRAAKPVYANELFTITEYVLQSLSRNLNCHKVQVTFLLHLLFFSEASCTSEKVGKEDVEEEEQEYKYFMNGIFYIWL